ncbi:hypothetical protein GCM10022381_05010 [Leifsonia kafniensis]|uniref:Cell division protein FtsL n=1 Tax=Leifsonia kafniensis TaxID=475957 RepID=A0ABP7K3H8_9MICO
MSDNLARVLGQSQPPEFEHEHTQVSGNLARVLGQSQPPEFEHEHTQVSGNLARVLRPSQLPEPEREQTPARRPLQIVTTRTQRKARPRIIYAFTAVTGIVVIILAQLLVSVGISQGAFEISTLQKSQVELGRTADSLNENLVRVSAPQALAANAEALGMVSNSNPVYLRLSDNAVLGAPSPAAGTAVKAAALVPNSLLTGIPLVTQLPVAGAALAPAPGVPAIIPADSGIPTPMTH